MDKLPTKNNWVSKYALPLTFAIVLLLAQGTLSSANAAFSDLPGQWQTLAPSGPLRQEISYVQAGSNYYPAGGGTLHEAFDPQTNSWSTVKPLPARLDHIQAWSWAARPTT